MEIELTKDEQQLVDLLTDKLIEVAHNPKLRKRFEVKYEYSTFSFYREDLMMSEIEYDILFRGAFVNNDYDRMQLWTEQIQDLYIKRSCMLLYISSMASDEMNAGNYGKAADLYYTWIIGSYSIDVRYLFCLAQSEQWETLASIVIKICRYGVHYLPLEKSDIDVLCGINAIYNADIVEVINTVFNKVLNEWADHFEKPVLAYLHYGRAVFYGVTLRKQQAEADLSITCKIWQLNETEKAKMYSYILERDKYDGAEAKEVILSYLDKYMPKVSSPYNERIETAIKAFFEHFSFFRPRPKKGSFDWLYNQAEKSYIAIMNNKGTERDYAYLRQLSEAYRTGNGVRRNLRLAECWAEMAKGTGDSYFAL